MVTGHPSDRARKRAPSRRALATRDRVLDAAERVFAARGFDGATIRDIAAAAGEPVGSVHHHGGGKACLFAQTVARRAEALSAARLAALETARAEGPPRVEAVVGAFMRPFFELAEGDRRWRDYARLVALVSADARWRDLAAEWFDPTAEVFIGELARLTPGAPRRAVAAGFVFAVSAMLALLTSAGRIETLAPGAADEGDLERLIAFCAAGLVAGAGAGD